MGEGRGGVKGARGPSGEVEERGYRDGLVGGGKKDWRGGE